MKKMFVLVSVMVFSLSFFAGCGKDKKADVDSKDKICDQLYGRMNTCLGEMMGDKADKNPLGPKEDFMKECKAQKGIEKADKCLEKKDCKDLIDCISSLKD
jgi:hypothetical protein